MNNNTIRIAYDRPWAVFVPTVIAFGLLNYLACCTRVNAEGTDLVLPPYAQRAADYRTTALANGETTLPASVMAPLLFEETCMGLLFRMGSRLFGGMNGIQMLLVVVWFIHFFELGMCVRICVACRATPWTTLRYAFCTITAGFAQLIPLMHARQAYLARVGAVAGGKKRG